MVQGKWIRPLQRRDGLEPALCFIPSPFPIFFGLPPIGLPHTQDLLEGLINGDDGKVVGMELLYDAFQKATLFSSSL